MTEEQIAYHELEMMQELDMLEEGTNICEILDDYVESKRIEEPVEPEPVELENHMVIGEYYDDQEN